MKQRSLDRLLGRSPIRERSGFTLVELLIVITIIGILASLSLYSVSMIRERSNSASAKSEISQLRTAIEQYKTDESILPGQGEGRRFTEETNQFPALYTAVYGKPPPDGSAGRSAPYTKLDEERIVVLNEDWQEGDEESDRYRPATKKERRNEKVDKYYLDPFNRPYIYRCNKGRKERDWMKNPDSFDLYSLGVDGEDFTILPDADPEESDDIH